MSKVLFQRIVSLHAAASELAKTIRLERLVDTGEAESRSLAARGAYRAVERRLLTLSRFFSLGRGEVSDESQGALPGLWEYGKYYPAPETSLAPGELDDIVAGVSRLFQAQNSLFETGFAKGYQSGQAVPATIGRSVMYNLERGIELLSRFCPPPDEETPATKGRSGRKQPSGAAGRKRRRASDKPRTPRRLTPTETETIQIVGECKGNMAAAARRLGKDRKTVEEAYRNGLDKLGKEAYWQNKKTKTRLLTRDRREQETVSTDSDRF